MTIDELAGYLKVRPATLYGWRHEGSGPPGVKVGRAVRFRREDVDAWITETNQDA
jgi:excisionase family DNA binding protein|tara:strand:+ start:647 stop:811 length:165 start_codon:yes stop_codon:yes gene_type:complete